MHVAFDIGNVLAEIKLEKFSTPFTKYINRVDPVVFLHRIQAAQDVGLITVEQALTSEFPSLTTVQVNELLQAWNDIVIPNEMMLNFMDILRSEGVKIALLSNMGTE